MKIQSKNEEYQKELIQARRESSDKHILKRTIEK